jgi:hypothetical protein
MEDLKDLRGVTLSVGDIVAYGKSDRNNPINIGTIVDITEKDICILGKGNSKVGKLCHWAQDRLIVLPNNYLEEIK